MGDIETEIRQLLRRESAEATSAAEVLTLMPDLDESGSGAASVSWRQRWVVAGVAAAVIVVIGGAVLWKHPDKSDGAPAIEPVNIPLNNNDWHSGDMSLNAGGPGVVEVTGDDCIYLRMAGVTMNVVWPAGYTASRAADGIVTVFNQNGEPVAHDGTNVRIGGSTFFGRPTPPGCHAESSRTWNLTQALEPLR